MSSFVEDIAQRWLSGDAVRLREWLTDYAPDPLHRLIATVPVWALIVLAVVAVLAAIWTVVQFFESAWKGFQAILNPTKAARDTFSPEPAANKKDIEKLGDQISTVQQNIDPVSSAKSRVHALKDKAALLAKELRYDGAFDLMTEAAGIASAAKHKELEFDCRMLQLSHAMVQAETGDRAIAIERVRSIWVALKKIDSSTWHHLAAELWLARVRGDLSEIIRLGNAILATQDLPMLEKVDVLSAMALAFARNRQCADLLNIQNAVRDVCAYLREDDPSAAMTLLSNYIESAASIGILEQRYVEEFITYIKLSVGKDDTSLLRIGDIISGTAEAIRRYCDTQQALSSHQILSFAKEIYIAGYEVVKRNANALKAMEFSLNTALILAEISQKDEALEWLSKADRASAMVYETDSPQARVAHRFNVERIRTHIFVMLAGCLQTPEREELFRQALNSAEKAQDLLEKCAGATSGNVDLKREVSDLKRQVLEELQKVPPNERVFISYRRRDSADVTGRLFDRLKQRFGNAVFKDVDSIPVGVDFRAYIENALDSTSVFLAVIGPSWMEQLDQANPNRDFVYVETRIALERGLPIIPVLVSGAVMPKANLLPESLRDLAFINATQLRPDPDFNTDIQRVMQSIDTHLNMKANKTH